MNSNTEHFSHVSTFSVAANVSVAVYTSAHTHMHKDFPRFPRYIRVINMYAELSEFSTCFFFFKFMYFISQEVHIHYGRRQRKNEIVIVSFGASWAQNRLSPLSTHFNFNSH